MKKHTKLYWICISPLLLIALLLLLVLLLFLVSPLVNDFTAQGVMQEIADTPLPPDTVKMQEFGLAAKLVGNGNGMQFLGGILIQSEVPIEDLSVYYAPYAKGEFSFIVETPNKLLKELNNPKLLPFGADHEPDTYVVYTWGKGTQPFCEFDLRGH